METTTQESQTEEMDAVEIIDVLIELIEFNFDGYYGYTTAAKNVENEQYKQILETHAQQRLDFTYELNKLINKYGHETIDGGHIIGKLHRAWMAIKAAVAEDDFAILSECAQAEEIVMQAYQTAM
ncbi:MAG: PA2169 family four-helix-bundle protein, partial [Anaerolineales bacterium]|nr:PA2169 family four-helix-bundle protein [Anaerolineales bacterium]